MVKRVGMVLGLFAILGWFFLTPAQAAKIFTFNEDFPFSSLSLGDSCTGELVDLTGAIHVVIGVNITPSGQAQLQVHANAQGISGVGENTGIKYEGTGALNLEIHTDLNDFNPFVFNAVLNVQLVSQGSADNLALKVKLHFTVNANGDLTAAVVGFELDCKG